MKLLTIQASASNTMSGSVLMESCVRAQSGSKAAWLGLFDNLHVYQTRSVIPLEVRQIVTKLQIGRDRVEFNYGIFQNII